MFLKYAKKTMAIAMAMGMLLSFSGCCIEHQWLDATCTTPKTCAKCQETEGEALMHDFSEQTYQDARTCKNCGEVLGTPLPAFMEEKKLAPSAVENTPVKFVLPCRKKANTETVTMVNFSNYKTFQSDDQHPAKDGYLWKTIDLEVVLGDENAYNYGYLLAAWYEDYYRELGDGAGETFSVNWHGKEYDACEFHTNASEGKWEKTSKFGWEQTITVSISVAVLLPVGYDGFCFGLSDPTSAFANGQWDGADPSDYVYFRMK